MAGFVFLVVSSSAVVRPPPLMSVVILLGHCSVAASLSSSTSVSLFGPLFQCHCRSDRRFSSHRRRSGRCPAIILPFRPFWSFDYCPAASGHLLAVSVGSESTTTIVLSSGPFWQSSHLSGSLVLVITFVVQPVRCLPLSSVSLSGCLSSHLHLHLSLLSALSALSGQSAVGHLFWPRSIAQPLYSIIIQLSFGR